MIVVSMYMKLVHAQGIIFLYVRVHNFDFQFLVSNQLEMSLLNGYQGPVASH